MGMEVLPHFLTVPLKQLNLQHCPHITTKDILRELDDRRFELVKAVILKKKHRESIYIYV